MEWSRNELRKMIREEISRTLLRATDTARPSGALSLEVLVDPDGGLQTSTKGVGLITQVNAETSAFGEQSVAHLTPVVQIQFPYNINPRLLETRLNGGSASVDTQRLKLSTGAAANQSSVALTKVPVKYNPGQGGLIRISTVYTAGVADSIQLHGIGSESDGYFFGYNGAAFGILRRTGGSFKAVQLIVTTEATSPGNVTIELDGNTTLVPVTDATGLGVTATANDIAKADYSANGRGWRASAHGPIVTFISYDAAVHGGDYSFVDTDATGAAAAAGITNLVTGVAPTDVWVAQVDWNQDKMDGSGPSGITLIKTFGNVYQIRYQCGFGGVEFSIENPATTELILVHIIQYANSSVISSLQNPTLPICMMCKNFANTSDLAVFSSTMAGFIEGEKGDSGVRHSVDVTSSSFVADTETPVLTIRNKQVYQGKENRVQTLLSFAGLSQESSQTSRVRAIRNGVLIGANFQDVSLDDSTIEVDTSASAISGGEAAAAQGITKAGSTDFEPKGDVTLKPGDTFTLTIIPNVINPDVAAAIGWIDDY